MHSTDGQVVTANWPPELNLLQHVLFGLCEVSFFLKHLSQHFKHGESLHFKICIFGFYWKIWKIWQLHHTSHVAIGSWEAASPPEASRSPTQEGQSLHPSYLSRLKPGG